MQIKKYKSTNEFDRLVENLLKGGLSLNMIQMAIREYVRRSKWTMPETVDILCGKENSSGLIYKQFAIITNTLGAMELVVRRARDRLQGEDSHDKGDS